MGLNLTILKMSPELFVWHYKESAAARIGHCVYVFVRENLTHIMTLWRRYDVRKFNADAILFGENLCKSGILSVERCWAVF